MAEINVAQRDIQRLCGGYTFEQNGCSLLGNEIKISVRISVRGARSRGCALPPDFWLDGPVSPENGLYKGICGHIFTPALKLVTVSNLGRESGLRYQLDRLTPQPDIHKRLTAVGQHLRQT